MMKTATIEPLTLTAQLARQEGKRGWFKWGCDSMKQLIEAESRLFARAGVQILSRFVPVSYFFTNYDILIVLDKFPTV